MENCENCIHCIDNHCGIWGHEITDTCDQYAEENEISILS